ncbi:MAG: acyl-CoA/acyl-ACP dehydrogenase [Nocardioides sp.]|nr:acyl-CoA/acyl-ACP dehydrogenase [Nocardioides sp.]
MRFELNGEQQAFAESLERLLTASDTTTVARAWSDGDTGPGLALWHRLAEQGVHALLVPEDQGGMGAGGVELVTAFEALGRHGVPGPYVESAAYLTTLVSDDDLLERLAAGAVATVSIPPQVPHALDGDAAELAFVVSSRLHRATVGEPVTSVDHTRRLSRVTTGDPLDLEVGPGAAFDVASLATAAQLLGCGERLLDDAVAYVKQRKQFGREIGSYQAIKHRLADVRIALDFARPLVAGAALDLEAPDRARDVSAAKVAASDAAYLASRVALQVHGAIGYTAEFDLSIWLLKVRALVTAWGTPTYHRTRILDSLLKAGA